MSLPARGIIATSAMMKYDRLHPLIRSRNFIPYASSGNFIPVQHRLIAIVLRARATRVIKDLFFSLPIGSPSQNRI